MSTGRPARDQREWIQQVERDTSSAIRSVRRAMIGLRTDIVEGNVGTPPPPIPVDSRTPTAPIELTYTSGVYLANTGSWMARAYVDFPDVTKATDASTISVDVYELWGYKVEPNFGTSYPGALYAGQTYPGADKAFNDEPSITYNMLDQSSESSFRTDGFTPGDQWRFRVRAVSKNGFYGLWSVPFSLFMVEDETPPSQLLPPVAVAKRGVISVTHDGTFVDGSSPSDLKYIMLAEGDSSSPTTEVARWGRDGGQYVAADLPYFEVKHYRVRAVDETGNYGPWSEAVIAYTQPLVDADVILSEIDAAKTHLKNINAGVSILPNSIITEHLVVTEDMTAALGKFLKVKADQVDVNSLWADEIFVGVADAVLVRADMFEGRYFTGGLFTGTEFQTNVEELTGLKWDRNGLRAYNASGQQTVKIDAFNGDITATSGVLTGLYYQTTLAALRGVKIGPDGLRAYNPDGFETVRINGDTGDITATRGTLTGLTYQTHLAGRTGVKISLEGFRQYDSRNREVVRIGGSEENLIVGELLTGMPGDSRVRISNNNAYGWPAITFIRGGFDESLAPAIFGRFTIRQPMLYPEVVIQAPNQSIVGGPNSLGLVRIEGDLRLSLGDQATYNLRSEQPFRVEARSPDGSWHFMGIGAKIMDLTTSDGNITLNSGGRYIMMKGVHDKTTGLPPNVYLAEDGGLFRSTSSKKYKSDIKELSLDRRLLDVPMVDWRDKFAQDEFDRLIEQEEWPLTEANASLLDTIQLQRIPGAIAEDVASKGGEEFVTYNSEGDVESLMYDRYALARTHLLQEEVRELRERVSKLESAKQ